MRVRGGVVRVDDEDSAAPCQRPGDAGADRAVAVVADDDGGGSEGPEPFGELALRRLAGCLAVALVEPGDELSLGDEPALDDRVPALLDEEAAGADSGLLECCSEAPAGFVVADDREEFDGGTQGREVGREVAGSAGDRVGAGDGDGGHRCLARDPRRAAVQVLVEQDVADHDHGQITRHVEDGGESLGRVLTVCVDCY